MGKLSRKVFSFPEQVDDAAARTVATGVLLLSLVASFTGQLWLTIPLTYGFIARVLAGPRLSPLALFATRVAAPRLHRLHRLTPGPPKRFAQAIGAAFTTASLCCWLAGEPTAAKVLLVVLAVPAALEAGLGYCVGCRLFALGMRLGIVPEAACLACADLWGPKGEARRHRLAP
ncbi:MAG: transporter permease [Acidimicrobiaceae bacterium]|nr:transporter permease [Acidimicrobiaceae bacterium]